jgi:hypothetical protein
MQHWTLSSPGQGQFGPVPAWKEPPEQPSDVLWHVPVPPSTEQLPPVPELGSLMQHWILSSPGQGQLGPVPGWKDPPEQPPDVLWHVPVPPSTEQDVRASNAPAAARFAAASKEANVDVLILECSGAVVPLGGGESVRDEAVVVG